MWSSNPRSLLLRALLLDCCGQLVAFSLISVSTLTGNSPLAAGSLHGQGPWLVFFMVLYPLLGWLFGSYTVLRWRQLPLRVLLQRLLITAVITMIAVAVARWLINPSDQVWLVYRRVQFTWLLVLSIWAFVVRLALRRGVLVPERPRLLLLAPDQSTGMILKAWRRVPQRDRLERIRPVSLNRLLDRSDCPLLVALAPQMHRDQEVAQLLDQLETCDPAMVRSMSLITLFEQHQERLPPVLLADDALSYDDLPWAGAFSVQAQLKRIADVMVAGLLLCITAPFIALAALLIWLEDRGPVLYTQQRSGWLGRVFTVYKLRTMTVQPEHQPAIWTQVGDQRITRVGVWLRRLRLDELPQLLNVLSGEMSLIGPRPERPELEHQLESHIAHYRKRHWMRPGLSGWAQVCAPYASSLEESDLKLSYDLYYLRHFSTWLDLVILFRTIKTVLKAAGR